MSNDVFGQLRVTGRIAGRLADRGWTDSTVRPDGFGDDLFTMPLIEPNRSAYIEHVVAEAYANAIYRSDAVAEFMKSIGEEPLDFGGGIKAISVRQLANVPVEVLRNVRYYDARGRRRRVTEVIASQIKEAIQKSIAMEP